VSFESVIDGCLTHCLDRSCTVNGTAVSSLDLTLMACRSCST